MGLHVHLQKKLHAPSILSVIGQRHIWIFLRITADFAVPQKQSEGDGDAQSMFCYRQGYVKKKQEQTFLGMAEIPRS